VTTIALRSAGLQWYCSWENVPLPASIQMRALAVSRRYPEQARPAPG
jgi:hypothetical protein